MAEKTTSSELKVKKRPTFKLTAKALVQQAKTVTNANVPPSTVPAATNWNMVLKTAKGRKASLTDDQKTTIATTTATPPTASNVLKRGIRAVMMSKRLTVTNSENTSSEEDVTKKKGPPKSDAMRQWAIFANRRKEVTSILEKPAEKTTIVRQSSASNTMTSIGRLLVLEQGCRTAFESESCNRSHADLQNLNNWFMKTKLQSSTDFDNLAHHEMETLCRRMQLISYHPNEVVFHQGDEGDALYLVFTGTVDIRVSQNVLGNVIEVTVCELGKNEFFGERALLNDEPRAATIVTKVRTELVKISREDYNAMLKQNQQDFINRMKVTSDGKTMQFKSSQEIYRRIMQKNPSKRTKQEIWELSKFMQNTKFCKSNPEIYPSHARELSGVMDFAALGPNTIVFKEGEVGDLFYIILNGSVDIKKESKDSRGKKEMIKIVTLSDGDHFGELALEKPTLHNPTKARSATVVTVDSCEFLTLSVENYNNTLQKVHQDNEIRKMSVLDRIPFFQDDAWNPMLLQQLAYILSEKRLKIGENIYTQGDKSKDVIFITRGEVIVTQSVTDLEGRNYSAFVERVGPYRILGLDAARSKSYHDIMYREETVTATTPVLMLILSKYDIFHRLDEHPEIREILFQRSGESNRTIMTLDRVFKTLKWQEQKREIMAIHSPRMLLTPAPEKKTVSKKVMMDTTPSQGESGIFSFLGGKDSAAAIELEYQAGLLAIDNRPIQHFDWEKRSPLLDANSLLLVSKNEQQLSVPSRVDTLAKFTRQYKPEQVITDAEKRHALLVQVSKASDTERVFKLEEGNPVVYLRTLSAAINPTDKPISSIVVKNNFVFSPRLSLEARTSHLHHMLGSGQNINTSTRRCSVFHPASTSLHLLLNVAHLGWKPVSARPAFRILGCFDEKRDLCSQMDVLQTEENADMHYLQVPLRKHMLLASSLKRGLCPSYGVEQLVKKLPMFYAQEDSSKKRRVPDYSSMVSIPVVLKKEEAENNVTKGTKLNALGTIRPKDQQSNCQYACVLMYAASKVPRRSSFTTHRKSISSNAHEPVLAIQGCFSTQSEAENVAQKLFQWAKEDLCIALENNSKIIVCVVPCYQWIYFDEYEYWRTKGTLPMKYKIPTKPKTRPPPKKSLMTKRRAVSTLTVGISQSKLDLQKAQRLHMAVCAKLGSKNQVAETGYSNKNVFSLEQKLKCWESDYSTIPPHRSSSTSTPVINGKTNKTKK